MPRLALALAFLFAFSLPAQDVMPVEQLVQTAARLKDRLDKLSEIERPGDEEKAALVAAEKELTDLAEWIDKQTGFTEDHYVATSGLFVQAHAQHGLRIANAGLKSFPNSRFLNDHAGFAQLTLASDLPPCAAQVAAWKAAEASFRKSLTCQPETWHAHAGLCQVLDRLDRCDEAMSELDTATKDPAAKEGMAVHWLGRVSMLMRAGKPKDALKLLSTEKVADDDKIDHLVFLVRASALANDAAATQAAITKLRAADTTPRSLIEAADALAYLGKKADALKLLAQRPPVGKFSNEQERVAQLYSQTGAAMEAFWNATDFSPSGPLRAALTKTLDHHFTVTDGGKQTDLSSSPVMMCRLLADAAKEGEPIKDWGNHTLFVLCARAASTHKPAAGMEQKLIEMFSKEGKLPGADDVPARILAIRSNLGDAQAAGVLTGLRALEKLQPKAGAPAVAPKPATPTPPAKK